MRSVRQLDLAVEQHDARRDGPVRWHVRAGDRAIPVLVDEPRHRPARHRDRRHHVVGVAPAALFGRGVLVLQAERIAGALGREVERDPGAQEDVVTPCEVGLVGRPHVHPTLLGPAERLDVTQTAATVLQIGFEAVRNLTLLVLPGDDQVVERRQIAFPLRSPHLEPGGHHLPGKFVVAGERPHREHRRGGFEIDPPDLDLLLHAAHRMSELHARIPQRVPDGRGQRLDLRPQLLGLDVVHEQDVEVAERRQFAPPVPADGEQRDPPLVGPVLGDRLIEHVDDPLVRHVRQRATVGEPTHRTIGTGGIDLILSPGVRRHRGRSTRSARRLLAEHRTPLPSASVTRTCRSRRCIAMGVF